MDDYDKFTSRDVSSHTRPYALSLSQAASDDEGGHDRWIGVNRPAFREQGTGVASFLKSPSPLFVKINPKDDGILPTPGGELKTRPQYWLERAKRILCPVSEYKPWRRIWQVR